MRYRHRALGGLTCAGRVGQLLGGQGHCRAVPTLAAGRRRHRAFAPDRGKDTAPESEPGGLLASESRLAQQPSQEQRKENEDKQGILQACVSTQSNTKTAEHTAALAWRRQQRQTHPSVTTVRAAPLSLNHRPAGTASAAPGTGSPEIAAASSSFTNTTSLHARAVRVLESGAAMIEPTCRQRYIV